MVSTMRVECGGAEWLQEWHVRALSRMRTVWIPGHPWGRMVVVYGAHALDSDDVTTDDHRVGLRFPYPLLPGQDHVFLVSTALFGEPTQHAEVLPVDCDVLVMRTKFCVGDRSLVEVIAPQDKAGVRRRLRTDATGEVIVEFRGVRAGVRAGVRWDERSPEGPEHWIGSVPSHIGIDLS